MTDQIVVKRYADAFLQFAQQEGGGGKVFVDLKSFKDLVLRKNPEFMEFLRTPEIAYAEKCGLIDRLLQEDFCEALRYFLKLLVSKGRIDKLDAILEYIRVTYSRGDEVEALLKTTFPLNLDVVQAIQQKLEGKFHKKFKFYIQLDGSLLGGIQVMFGNTVIDGSVRRRLDELKEQLRKVRV